MQGVTTGLLIARLFIARDLFQQGWLGYRHPESLASRVLYANDATIGYGLSIMMLLGTAIIVADVFVNDVLPSNIQLRVTRKYHHWLYMIPGAIFMGQTYVAYSAPETVLDDPVLPLAYFACALLCGAVALIYYVTNTERRKGAERRSGHMRAEGS